MSRSLCAVAFLLVMLLVSPAPAATACEDLAKLSLPNTTITLAQNVAPGALTPPSGRGGQGGASARGGNQFANLPALCRIQATLKPSSDSDIKMELWMPVAANWNGKFRGSGNGGSRGRAEGNAGPLSNCVSPCYSTPRHHNRHEGCSSYSIHHPAKIHRLRDKAAH